MFGLDATRTKLLELGVIISISVLGTWLPHRFGANARLLSLGNAFSGGVMLSAGFLHMLPDAAEAMQAAEESEEGGDGGGGDGGGSSALGAADGDGGEFEVDADPLFVVHALAVAGILIPFLLERSGALGGFVVPHAHGAGHADDGESGTPTLEIHSPRSLSQPAVDFKGTSTVSQHRAKVQQRLRHSYSEDANADPQSARLVTIPASPYGSLSETSDSEDENEDVASSGSPTSALLVLIVLSVHSIVAGLAIGLQEDADDTLTIFVAIVLHKLFESLVLGVSTVRAAQTRCVNLLELAVFNLATPLGILIGIAVGGLVDVSGQGIAAVTAVSAGTFIYIALIEVITEEFDKEAGERAIKFSAYLIGVVVMGTLGLFV